MMTIAVQAAGALAILTAFALVQRNILSTYSRAYLLLSLGGGSATAATAFVEKQWGFTVLQCVWALVAVWGLAVGARSRA
jgi:hypothetical protein